MYAPADSASELMKAIIGISISSISLPISEAAVTNPPGVYIFRIIAAALLLFPSSNPRFRCSTKPFSISLLTDISYTLPSANAVKEGNINTNDMTIRIIQLIPFVRLNFITPLAKLCTVNSTDEMKKRSEEHTSELQSRENLVCRLLLEKKK